MRARDNPFATAHLERLAFRFPPGLDWEKFLARLAASAYRGAIIGPEGSGKTTFLEQLSRPLQEVGFEPFSIRANVENRRVWADLWRTRAESVGSQTMVLLDGAERLSRWQWRRLKRLTANSAGLIVTAHRATRLPTVMNCHTSPRLFAELVNELLGTKSPMDSNFLGECFERNGGNLRLALLELYDRHAARELAVCG